MTNRINSKGGRKASFVVLSHKAYPKEPARMQS